MPKMRPWGYALEKLVADSGMSQYEVCRRAKIEDTTFYRMCRGERGPGVKQLDRVLAAMGYTWHNWAIAYEAVKTGHAIAAAPKAVYKKKKKPRAKKVSEEAWREQIEEEIRRLQALVTTPEKTAKEPRKHPL